MPLLPNTSLKAATDKLARIYTEFAYFIIPSVDLTVTSGTLLQAMANLLLEVSKGSDDYDIESDLNSAFYTVASKLNAAEIMSNNFVTSLTALNTHYGAQSDFGGLAEYLLGTNNPSGTLNTYVVLVDAFFQDFWSFAQSSAIDAESVMGKPIHPSWRATSYPDSKAMGQYVVAGGAGFTDGYAQNSAYGGVNPTVEVTTTFTGGGAAPTCTITGTDAEGISQTWTATVTGGNNPATAVATTITPAITTASARLTVAVGSTTGIVAGSVLTVNAGLVDEETILVESIAAGPTITAAFLKNHGAGAALTGKTTWLTTCGTAGRRLRDVTAIAVGISGHTAGTVRVIGCPERSPI